MAPHRSDLAKPLLAAGLLAVVLAVAAYAGPAALLTPNAAMLVPGAVFLAALWRWDRPWVRFAAALGVLLMPLLVLGVFGRLPALLAPRIRADFLATVLLALAATLALPVLASAPQRLRDTPPLRGALTRPGYAAVLVAVAVGALATGWAASTPSGEEGALAVDVPVTAVTLRAAADEFVPATLQVPAGELVKLTVRNEDPRLHTFSYRMGDRVLDHDLAPGAAMVLVTRFDASGTFWCKPHSNGDRTEGMVGRLEVGR